MQHRKLLVTSALPYANGDIHLGHMVEHIQTDIFVRFQKLIGNTCYYMCADDAHGTAIMLSAEKADIKPEQYIEEIRNKHIKDFEGFSISHDSYYSTHSEENKYFSELIYKEAVKAEAIEEKKIKQYFCEESGLFLADRFIKGTCPNCKAENQYGDACEKCFATYDATQLINPISVYSGKPPILKESNHYFFKLSLFEKSIQDWLKSADIHKSVKNKLQEWFDVGLKNWDISRDAPYFGFQIPDSDNKYFYVWLDAPVGYIATTKQWCDETKKESFENIWKKGDFEIHHFIGKDILYFHTLFWPAMLSVSQFSLPKKIAVHGFLTVNGEKMSKSRGTFILASTYLKHLNPEFLRYYYASKLTEGMDDIDLNLEDFTHKINSDVLGKVVNIASRLGSILAKRCDHTLTTVSPEAIEMLTQIQDKAPSIKEAYDTLHFQQAMKDIMFCADLANKFIDTTAPWSVVKDDPKRGAELCTAGINACRLLIIYLKPVLPSIAAGIETFLNCDSLSWSDLNLFLENHRINPYKHLVSRINLDDVKQILI